MPGPKDDAPFVPLAPAISRSAWGIVLLLHLAIVPLAVSTLPSGLSRADLAQFVVARMLGMAGFVLGPGCSFGSSTAFTRCDVPYGVSWRDSWRFTPWPACRSPCSSRSCC